MGQGLDAGGRRGMERATPASCSLCFPSLVLGGKQRGREAGAKHVKGRALLPIKLPTVSQETALLPWSCFSRVFGLFRYFRGCLLLLRPRVRPGTPDSTPQVKENRTQTQQLTVASGKCLWWVWGDEASFGLVRGCGCVTCLPCLVPQFLHLQNEGQVLPVVWVGPGQSLGDV